MAQYGGQQPQEREVRLITDEHGNPIQKTEEHETVVQSNTGGQYQREVRHTDEHGTIVLKTDEHGNPIRSATRGRGTGTYGTGGHPGDAGMEYTPGGHSLGQIGHQGLGTECGSAGGTMGDYGSRHQGLDIGGGGGSIGQTGNQGLGTERGSAGGNRGDTCYHQGLGQGNTGTDYKTSGRSVGQTGYQGLGTEPTTGSYQSQAGATRVGGAGVGTGPGSAGSGDAYEKKGVMDKIKEKLPGHHD